MSAAGRESFYEMQGGRCLICGCEEPEDRRFALDHCHETGVLRGLLCTRCNVGLGYFRDSVKLLKSAVDYLEGTMAGFADICPVCRDSFLERVVEENLDNEAYRAAPERPAPRLLMPDRPGYVRAGYICGSCDHSWQCRFSEDYLAT